MDNGFVPVAPEQLTLEQQIYIWNNADEIASINGTIPLNVVFSQNENLKVIVLNKTSIFHENHLILLKMRNVRANFIDIYKELFKIYPRSLSEGSYFLGNPKDFIGYCNNNSLECNYFFQNKLCFF